MKDWRNETCNACGGSGVDDDMSVKCVRCNGDGWLTVSLRTHPNGRSIDNPPHDTDGRHGPGRYAA